MGRVQAKARARIDHCVWPPGARGDLSEGSFSGVLGVEYCVGGNEWDMKRRRQGVQPLPHLGVKHGGR